MRYTNNRGQLAGQSCGCGIHRPTPSFSKNPAYHPIDSPKGQLNIGLLARIAGLPPLASGFEEQNRPCYPGIQRLDPICQGDRNELVDGITDVCGQTRALATDRSAVMEKLSFDYSDSDPPQAQAMVHDAVRSMLAQPGYAGKVQVFRQGTPAQFWDGLRSRLDATLVFLLHDLVKKP